MDSLCLLSLGEALCEKLTFLLSDVAQEKIRKDSLCIGRHLSLCDYFKLCCSSFENAVEHYKFSHENANGRVAFSWEDRSPVVYDESNNIVQRRPPMSAYPILRMDRILSLFVQRVKDTSEEKTSSTDSLKYLDYCDGDESKFKYGVVHATDKSFSVTICVEDLCTKGFRYCSHMDISHYTALLESIKTLQALKQRSILLFLN
ncbi:MAG: hypothetical protein Harvfovirus12_21 [Harvfovirus sp.]|uniref:Uncharacterized protein n=1 Tax=Harvfovirus sp. TaxID=2487768 RepID=A0A3G5A1A4_9VIRU|nr:MAG: hypothetical protein Harvfovirus12_21 [Harvfovirus sp.]